jgi:L-lactate dehydrogenase
MSNKVMLVGTGNVGTSVAYTLVNQRTAVNELILTDINQADAEGEAMDLEDALAVAPSYLKIRAGNYSDAKDADIVIITAGAPQKDQNETRLQLLDRNKAILKSIVDPIMASGFDGIFIVISNPVDILAYYTWQYSGLPAEQVIGSGTILDSDRLRLRLGQRLGVHPQSVHAYMVGEHGDSELALWSSATVGGEPINRLVDQSARDEIEKSVRNKAYSIIQKKGATYYGIGAATARIINCILSDERRILPVSSLDDYADLYNGWPAVIGRHGVIRRLNLELSEQEGIKFEQSNNALRAIIE